MAINRHIVAVNLSRKAKRLIRDALAEDIGRGDVTSLALLKKSHRSRAVVVAKKASTVCGAPFAAEVFRQIDRRCRVRILKQDGEPVQMGARVLTVEGPTLSILAAERTALNFLKMLSGIASFTSQYVKAVKGTRCRILDTRKTTPGWRELEKYAVRCGGGKNHRFALDEMVLIKDNHLVCLNSTLNPIGKAVRLARKKYPKLRIEVECDHLEQVRQALNSGVDIILLDNMSIAQMKRAVQLARKKTELEASGNITLRRVRQVAKTGVDYISVGALTHSAPAMDFSLEIC